MEPNERRENGSTARQLLETIGGALGLAPAALDRVAFQGAGGLSSAFAVTDLAVGAIGGAALALSELIGLSDQAPCVIVDRRLASLWFGLSIKPIGWELPPGWDPIAGDYRTEDGWIRLHTNAVRHRQAALAVLGCAAERAAVANAVEAWSADRLEQAVVGAGGGAAAMRTVAEWDRHAQGRAVAKEALIAFGGEASAPATWQPVPGRPLQGLKVLDLTRVLAGPVATRFLAGYGAEVLRIDPPEWDEVVVPEVNPGKRCARLNLHAAPDRAIFEGLLAAADVLVHGYRPGALDALGFGEARRQALRPGLIDVSLDAYGWSGPWRDRRGFDSLLQMSTGIAALGMCWKRELRPVPLPVQALDHATGYLMAAAVLKLLLGRLRGEAATTARLSLARTAALLVSAEAASGEAGFRPPDETDYAEAVEATDWGPARRVRAPASVGRFEMRWSWPASRLGSAKPEWIS